MNLIAKVYSYRDMYKNTYILYDKVYSYRDMYKNTYILYDKERWLKLNETAPAKYYQDIEHR